ncbi:histidine phosphatase family protein [Isoptericola sp. b441]|uniref:Histidine phosphatase family protein n=1 Tax=Actinotalea lenta TaxID=3064654 RepID=A0ABT9D866_9CELL|nr:MULTISPECIES: histidine phosphatase family protein [unclassified Isoptericola]MDO8107073.1 histidine phosphatase family protein [Isoptericola sp. b441]MDO8121213.1 histidine phosphatase family protein [Isoptericola sp. b490]
MQPGPFDHALAPDPDALTLYLVRHGRTVFNAQRRIQGWSDSDLTDDGLAGVRATARNLEPLELHAAYTSPSERTLTTSAEILAYHPGLEPEARDGLREFNFGVYEERPESELVDHVDWMVLFREVLEGTYPGFPGGESAQVYLERVQAVFADIETRHRPGENVLVVSHGMTLMVYLAMSGIVSGQALANASVTVVHVRDGRRTAAVVGHDPSGTAPREGRLQQAEATAIEAEVEQGD